MTMDEIATEWVEWYDMYGASIESVRDFCNYYATSYEEYNAMWLLLAEMIEE